jgi:hypothetical protein
MSEVFERLDLRWKTLSAQVIENRDLFVSSLCLGHPRGIANLAFVSDHLSN